MIRRAAKYLSNFPGWRTNRKIVVIESDDWGSIRMPDMRVYHHLKERGINISSGDNQRYNTIDTLASKDDLDALFNTLRKFKDGNGRHPMITALSLCANPDFDKIRQDQFTEYHYESFVTTLERYGRTGAFEMWKQGERENLFYAQFHGREHLNIKVWMDDLRLARQDTVESFECGFWGFRPNNKSGISYQAAFDLDTKNTLLIQKEVIKSGLDLFEKLHGRRAVYFVPPNGAIHQEIIDCAVSHGIKYVSTPKIHIEPQGDGMTKKRYRYIGKRGNGGMIYLTRNCFFEPNYEGKGFSVNECLSQIEIAFRCNKPAIISTHRVNYVGGLKPENRLEGNKALGSLLSKILLTWPNVEFMTSVELADLIRDDKK